MLSDTGAVVQLYGPYKGGRGDDPVVAVLGQRSLRGRFRGITARWTVVNDHDFPLLWTATRVCPPLALRAVT